MTLWNFCGTCTRKIWESLIKWENGQLIQKWTECNSTKFGLPYQLVHLACSLFFELHFCVC